MIVTYKEYENDRQEFFAKHHNDFNCITKGNSAEYYTKTYGFSDGAVWYEVMQKMTVEETIEVFKCKVKVDADLLSTEYWSTDNSTSNFVYEPWKNN